MFTFKAQAKSNAKRFLVQTAKVDNFEEYLTQDGDGNWGTYLDGNGKPAKFADVKAAILAQAEATTGQPAAEEPVEQEAPAPAASAFGAFALSQLGGEHNATTAAAAAAAAVATEEPAAPAKTARTGATSTTGLKIEKDREERNGVQRQSKGSVGDRLWALFDSVGKDCTLMQAKAMAEAHGLSTTSAAIALYRWRKFNGYTTAK